jgi:hypothetical protein
MTVRSASFLAVATLAIGCTSADPAAPTKTSTDDNQPSKPAEDTTANFGSPLRVTATIPAVGPGEEGTKCLKVRLGNSDTVKIGRIHNTLSPASHHLIISAVTDPTETESDLFDCRPFHAALIGAPLAVSQKHDDNVLMPDGVAFSLDGNQLMHLETHYINTGTDTVDVVAESDLYPLVDAGDTQEASFLIVGTLNIQVPAMSQMENPWAFVTLPPVFAGANIYGATGHTHRFGTAARLAIAGPDGANPTTIYDPSPYTWSEADLKFFDKPLNVPAGGGFSFQCAWNNTSTDLVTYGESALQEMCFFWTYYYPKQDGNRVMLAGLDNSPYDKKADGGAQPVPQ